MKKVDIFLANVLFAIHILIALIILFGWLFPQIRIIYLAILIVWPICWIFLGYCPLTKWQFDLRRKYRGYEKGLDAHNEFINYYVFTYFKKNIPVKIIYTGGLIFFLISVVLNLVFK